MFTEPQFDPVDGLKNKDVFPTDPPSEAAMRKQFQDMFDQCRGMLAALIDALGNTEAGSSGAENIGSAEIDNVTGTTVRGQLADLKAQIDDFVEGSVSDGSITTAKLADEAVTVEKCAPEVFEGMEPEDGSITTAKLADESVTSAKMADGIVSPAKIAALAVTSAKLADGAVTPAKLGNIATLKLTATDTLSYEAEKLMLAVSGCTPVQLVPVVYGTGANPPAGTYPPGTLYIRYQN